MRPGRVPLKIARHASVDSTAPRRTGLAVLLILVSLAALALAVSAALGNQLFLDVGLIRGSIRNPRNPAILASLAALVAFRLDRDRAWTQIAGSVERFASLAAVLVVGVVLAVSFRYGSTAVGGADSSGYANEARMLRSFTSEQPLPAVMATVDWADKAQIFTPLGLHASGGAFLRPTYPPGYPAMMAAASALAGERAIFAIVPLAAAATVWLVFIIGREMAGRVGGLFAAVLMAVSPIFLFQAFQPMSDVPATFFWMLAFALLLRGSPHAVVWAGAATALAGAIRPNYLLLAAAAVPLIAWWKPANVSRSNHVVRFAVGLAPVVLLLLIWNTVVYGSPTQTGYGSPNDYFSIANVRPNLALYLGWMVSLHGPFVLLGLLAPVALWLIPADGTNEAARNCRATLSAIGFVLMLQAFYLPYLVFDSWPYTRFLLPGLGLLFVLFSIVATRALARTAPPIRVLAGWTVVLFFAVSWIATADRLGVFNVGEGDGRFERAASSVNQLTPSTAVLFSMLHSGSLTYYTDRPIARWDVVPEGSLAQFAKDLSRAGRMPYLVLDDQELADFEGRHGELARAFPQLGPVVLVAEPFRVRLFDLSPLTRE